MEDIVRAIKENLQTKNYYSALFITLTIPSICGALESDDGEDNRSKYKDWYDRYITGLQLKGDDCYKLRCSILHQGTTSHKSSSFSRVLFTFPNPSRTIYHNNVVNGALNLDILLFCNQFLGAIEKWYEHVKDMSNYKKNTEKTIRTYPIGLAPYMVGMPLIS